MRSRHEAIAETSQYEDFSRNDTGWSGLLYKCANANYAHKLVRLDLPTPCDMRAPGAATGVYALECAMDELAVALELDPMELRLRCYSERDQNDGHSLHQQGACANATGRAREAFGWDKRNPEPRSMRDGTRARRLGHGDRRLGSAADADRRAHRADRQRPRRGRLRDLRHRHRHLHHHGAGRRRHARPAARQRHRQARRFVAAAGAGRGRIMDRGFGVAGDRERGRRDPRRAPAPRQDDAELAARRRRGRTTSTSPTARS